MLGFSLCLSKELLVSLPSWRLSFWAVFNGSPTILFHPTHVHILLGKPTINCCPECMWGLEFKLYFFLLHRYFALPAHGILIMAKREVTREMLHSCLTGVDNLEHLTLLLSCALDCPHGRSCAMLSWKTLLKCCKLKKKPSTSSVADRHKIGCIRRACS